MGGLCGVCVRPTRFPGNIVLQLIKSGCHPPPLTGRRGMRHRRRLDVRERLPNYPYLALYVYHYQMMEVWGDGWLVGWLCPTRDTREGWPLPTVETEANGDSKRTNEKGPSLIDSLGLSCRCKRFCSALAALVGPEQNIRFPHRTLCQFLCPHRPESWAGSRAGSPVSWYVSLCLTVL